MNVLKIKRISFFVLGFLFFLLPGQNYFLTLQEVWQPPIVQGLGQNWQPADYPVLAGLPAPGLTAYSIVALDKDSGVLMYGKNEKTSLLPASTVKMMTALVSLDHYQLNEVLTVNGFNDFGQDMKLLPGERISVKNLLYGLLIASANDAALVLAQNYPGGEKAFVKAMNQKAVGLHLEDSYFANPTGLDTDESEQLLTDYSYTTALDLARLASAALKNPIFREIVAIPRATVTDAGGQINHQLFNINQLLNYVPGVKGIKTGWTEDAGECLVTLTERDGREVIAVVLASQDRFAESQRLIEWVFNNYQWETTTPAIENQ